MNKSKINIAQLFFDAARTYPNNIAIVEDSQSINYDQLAEDVKRTAAYFSAKGIKEGDRVLVFVPMSIDLYRIVLALFQLGAAAVFLDEWVSKERLLLCCNIAECKGFVGTPKARFLSYFAKELRRIPIKLNWRTRANAGLEVNLVDKDASALITFTTGSTGIPKAADRSHQFLTSQFDILKDKINANSMDVDMPILPIVLFVNLGVGATSIIAKYNSRKPASLQPNLLVEQIRKHKVNRLTASPFVVNELAKYLINNKVELNNLETIYTGGAPVFPTEAENYVKAFVNSNAKIIYGSTEAEPISSIDAKELLSRRTQLNTGLPVGKIHPATHTKVIKIVNTNLERLSKEELSEMECKENEIGEVIVAGDHVLKRYFNNPEAFALNKIIVDDVIWHRTGDSGKKIENELYLSGRCKQLIKREDDYISPFIVENLLQEIDGVSMGTIVEKDGNLLLALESDRDQNELLLKVDQLQFDKLIVLDSIPRDPRHFSKIDYPRLMEVLEK